MKVGRKDFSISGGRTRPVVASGLLAGIVLLGVSVPVFGSTSHGASAQTVNVNLPRGESLSLFSPIPSNLTLLSVTGMAYNIYSQSVSFQSQAVSAAGVQPLERTISGNEIVFVPGNGSTYSIKVNLSSPNTTYALIFEGVVPSGLLVKNVTDVGMIVLDVNLSVVASKASTAGWNLLYGYTGINLAGVGLSSTGFLIAFALAAITLVGVGARFSRKLLYLGTMFMLGLGTFFLGLLVIGLAIGVYLASFVAIRSYFAIKARGERQQEGVM
jgi:hypothetical protein